MWISNQENYSFKLLHFDYEQYILLFTKMNYHNEIYNHKTRLPLIANISVLWNLFVTFLLF